MDPKVRIRREHCSWGDDCELAELQTKLRSADGEQKADSSLPGISTHFTVRRPVGRFGMSICNQHFVIGKWTWRQLFFSTRKSAMFSF